jgi:hypothetical protein
METKRDIIAQNTNRLVNQLNIGIYDALALQRIARSLHRSHENECNYGLTPNRVERMSKENNFYAQEQGDPRGWPITVSPEPINEDGTGLQFSVCPL